MRDVVGAVAAASWKGELRIYGEVTYSLFVDRGYLTGIESDDRALDAQERPCAPALEEVVDAALSVRQGFFEFIDGSSGSQRPGADARKIPIERLLRLNAQRRSEALLHAAQLGGSSIRPIAIRAVREDETDAVTRSVHARLDGGHSMRSIARELAIEEYCVLKAVHTLSTVGAIQLNRELADGFEQGVRLIAEFSFLITEIFAKARSHGVGSKTEAYLRDFLVTSGLSTYIGEQVADGFDISTEAIRAGSRRAANAATPVTASLYQVLRDVVCYAAFSAGDLLPHDVATDLAKYVHEQLLTIEVPAQPIRIVPIRLPAAVPH